MELSSPGFQQHRMSGQAGHNWHVTITAKQKILYSAAVILLGAALAYLFVAVELKGWPAVYVFAIVFWIVGIAHIFIFPPLLPLLHSNKGFLFSLLLGIILYAAVWIVFFITGFQAKHLAMAAAAAFVLPHLLEECLEFYYAIPPEIKSSASGWLIPADAKPDTRMSLLLNSIHFRVKIKVNYYDAAETLFTVNLSEKITLGNMFLRFLYDHHDTIEIINSSLQPYAWQFSTKSKFGNIKMLDPGKTLKENGIKAEDIILIERVKPA